MPLLLYHDDYKATNHGVGWGGGCYSDEKKPKCQRAQGLSLDVIPLSQKTTENESVFVFICLKIN